VPPSDEQLLTEIPRAVFVFIPDIAKPVKSMFRRFRPESADLRGQARQVLQREKQGQELGPASLGSS